MREYSLAVQPGQTHRINIKGDYFRVRDADAPVTVEAESRDGLLLASARFGSGQGVRTAGEFYRLRITNDTAGAVAVIIIVGFGQYENDQAAGMVKVSEVQNPITVASVQNSISVGDEVKATLANFYTATFSTNAVITVVSPAANINGVVVQGAVIAANASGGDWASASLMAGPQVPTSGMDASSAIIVREVGFGQSSVVTGDGTSNVALPLLLPAGNGLFVATNIYSTSSSVQVGVIYEVK